MGFIQSLILGAALEATATAVETVLEPVTDAVSDVAEVVSDAAEITGKVLTTTVNAVGKGYEKIKPDLEIAAYKAMGAIKSASNKIQNTIVENNIKNTFNDRKKNYHYLINCRNKNGSVYTYDIYNEKMQVICTASCKKDLFTYTVQLIDDDNTLLLILKQKGMKNEILKLNESIKESDPTIVERIKTYAVDGNILSKTVAFKENDKIVGHSVKKKDYVGGQYVLDMPDAKYTIPLLAQEIIRETRATK